MRDEISWRKKNTRWHRPWNSTRHHATHFMLQIGIHLLERASIFRCGVRVWEDRKKQHVKQIVIFSPAPDPPPVCFLSLFIAICMHATHISFSLAVAQQSTMQRESNKSRLYAVALSCNAKWFAIEIWVGREQKLARRVPWPQPSAPTGTCPDDRRPRRGMQPPTGSSPANESVLGHKYLSLVQLRVSCSPLNSPNFLCLVCVNIKQKPLLANHDWKRAGAGRSEVQINIPQWSVLCSTILALTHENAN